MLYVEKIEGDVGHPEERRTKSPGVAGSDQEAGLTLQRSPAVMGEALERIVGEVVRRVAHRVGAERGEGVDLAGLGENVGETIPRPNVVEGQRRLDCDAVVNVGLGDTGCGAAF